MFALVDCNNFYASCERLFQPRLIGQPVIILSNNDGCVIARSNEAKALGIGMGVPFFQVQGLCKRHGVHVFSSNYTFYGDMSQRVMRVIEQEWPVVEIYSIDEAFLDLRSLPADERLSFCRQLQQRIGQYTGIPVSIGIGASKTLAKLANHIAKKELKVPVFDMGGAEFWMAHIPIQDVWGVGRKWGRKLVEQGLYTAQDLAKADLRWIRARFNVSLQRTALELRGISCAGSEHDASRKSILSSKSFGRSQTEWSTVSQAIASYCARACEKLRQQRLRAGYLSVFVRTNSFRQDLPQYRQSAGMQLIHPSDDVRYLTAMAKMCLQTIFRSGFHYHKVGVLLSELGDKRLFQPDLLHPLDKEQSLQSERLMDVYDAINQRFGRHTLRLAAEGFAKPWSARIEKRSPCYTTCWEELAMVY